MDDVDISSLSISSYGAEAETVDSDEAVDKLYPFLSDKDTISHIYQSNIMFLMRGPPGCGKSTVVRRLQKLYADIVVCSADHFFLTADGEYHWDHNKLSEAHLACQQKAQEAAENKKNIVIDNTNIHCWEMSMYYDIARHNGYIVIVIIPYVPWALQPTQLMLKNMHGISLKRCNDKLEAFKKVYPLYWAWFLNQSDSEHLLELAYKCFAACVSVIPEFEQQLRNCFSLTDEETLQFSDHYKLGNSKVKMLHCTAFYAGRQSDEVYTSCDVLRQSVGKCFSLKVTGVVLTTRTMCARVELAGDQLLLQRRNVAHQSDALVDTETAVCRACMRTAEGESNRDADCRSLVSATTAVCSVHSRAHITVGYTQSTEPVQAGDDLLNVLHLAACSLHVADPVTVDDGTLYYYGSGQCSVQFSQPLRFSALFSAHY